MNADFVKARNLIDQTDWDSLLSKDVNTSACMWQSKFLEIMELCIPRVMLPKRKNPPWLCKSIVQAFKKRNMLFKRAKRSCHVFDFLKYKRFRNNVTEMQSDTTCKI